MAPNSTERKQIFKDVVYYDASSCLDQTHRTALQGGGAVEYVPDGDEIEWEIITHVFTNSVDFPGRNQASEQQGLAIMTVFNCICVLLIKQPRWIEITVRRSVLQK